jgi:hypothetical protein
VRVSSKKSKHNDIDVGEALLVVLETLGIESSVEEQKLNAPNRLGKVESACRNFWMPSGSEDYRRGNFSISYKSHLSKAVILPHDGHSGR